MSMNRTLFPLMLSAVLLAGCSGVSSSSSANSFSHDYGVFLGLDHYEERLSGYQTIVIDVAEWNQSDINKLKDNGQAVYSYLSIGSLENYRDYYDDFKDHVLGPYENWPDEYWMDVSYTPWQDKMASLGQALLDKGADGLFLDNADVFYFYPETSIRDGLDSIFLKLSALGIPLISNGGDSYVETLLERGKETYLSGVNQETVFSSIEDYDGNVFGRQTDEDREYFQDYLAGCSAKGLKVYLLEYTTDDALIKDIDDYCLAHGYLYYVSTSVDLA